MDCFVVLLLAMTTPQHRHCDYETVIARLCRRSENLVIETTTHNPHRHCEALKKAVAISAWDTKGLNHQHHYEPHYIPISP